MMDGKATRAEGVSCLAGCGLRFSSLSLPNFGRTRSRIVRKKFNANGFRVVVVMLNEADLFSVAQ